VAHRRRHHEVRRAGTRAAEKAARREERWQDAGAHPAPTTVDARGAGIAVGTRWAVPAVRAREAVGAARAVTAVTAGEVGSEDITSAGKAALAASAAGEVALAVAEVHLTVAVGARDVHRAERVRSGGPVSPACAVRRWLDEGLVALTVAVVRAALAVAGGLAVPALRSEVDLVVSVRGRRRHEVPAVAVAAVLAAGTVGTIGAVAVPPGFAVAAATAVVLAVIAPERGVGVGDRDERRLRIQVGLAEIVQQFDGALVQRLHLFADIVADPAVDEVPRGLAVERTTERLHPLRQRIGLERARLTGRLDHHVTLVAPGDRPDVSPEFR